MKLYVAMIEDHHTDPDCAIFATAEAAINWAREEAKRHAKEPEDYVEEEVEGWIFFAYYSGEDGGDSIWVIEKELHDG